jgi:hypothetical protein
MGNTGFIFASLIWGSIGVGFAIYGKRQRATVPLCGGIALVAISYLVSSPLYMSLAGVGLVAAMIWLRNRIE